MRRRTNQVSRVLVGATQSIKPASSNATASNSEAAAAVATGDDFGEDPFASAAATFNQEAAKAQSVVSSSGTASAGPSSTTTGGWGLAARGGRAGGRGGRGPGGRSGPVPLDHFCKRCGETGKHFFWQCPTLDDPAYDPPKQLQRATGIPQTALRRNADGSILLPTGETGELVANQTAFQKQLAMMAGQAAAKPAQTASRTPLRAAAAPPSPLRALPAPEAAAAAASTLSEGPIEAAENKAPDCEAAASEPAAAEEAAATRRDPSDALFDEEEDEGGSNAATMAPASISDRAALPPASDSGALDIRAVSVYHEVLAEVMPARLSLKKCNEAFGGAQPLSRDEFRRFQRELRELLMPSGGAAAEVAAPGPSSEAAAAGQASKVGSAEGGLLRRVPSRDAAPGGKQEEARTQRRRSRSRSGSRKDRRRGSSRDRGRGRSSSREKARRSRSRDRVGYRSSRHHSGGRDASKEVRLFSCAFLLFGRCGLFSCLCVSFLTCHPSAHRIVQRIAAKERKGWLLAREPEMLRHRRPPRTRMKRRALPENLAGLPKDPGPAAGSSRLRCLQLKTSSSSSAERAVAGA